MGDCRIKIVIAAGAAAAAATTESQDSSSTSTKSTAQVYSSDTTIREVIENHAELWTVLTMKNNDNNPTAATAATSVTLWDCTLHPPKDITTWPTTNYPHLVGPKSLTLHDAGWYPSATLILVPTGVDPTSSSTTNAVGRNTTDDPYIDVQYNTMTTTKGTGTEHNTSSSAGPVEFQNKGLGSTSKPSEVMTSLVSQRFDDEQTKPLNKDGLPSSSVQRAKFLQQKIRQRERAHKLDQRIEALEEHAMLDDNNNNDDDNNNDNGKKKKPKKKNQKVSKQVLRMLVKSRATGDERLKLQDRLYFQCILLCDDDNDEDVVDKKVTSTKEYRYFSPQDTFARISNSFQLPSTSSSSLLTEVLCRLPSSSSSSSPSSPSTAFSYRRFPVTMRIYEAIANGFLSDHMDTFIVRWYKDRDDATVLSVLDKDDDEDDNDNDNNDTNGNISMKRNQKELQHDQIQHTMEPTADSGNNDVEMSDAQSTPISNGSGSTNDNGYFDDPTLSALLQTLDCSKKKKALSSKSIAAAVKVKQMKMKSKAKGDAKRIKMEDRFFLDVVIVVVEDKSATSHFHYLARTDPMERILQYVDDGKLKSSKTSGWEFLVVNNENNPDGGTSDCCQFQRIMDPSISMKDLEANGDVTIHSFDRLILKRR